MNTNEPDPELTRVRGPGGFSQAGVPAGWPDAAVLERMANEFLTALPETGSRPDSAPVELPPGIPGAPPQTAALNGVQTEFVMLPAVPLRSAANSAGAYSPQPPAPPAVPASEAVAFSSLEAPAFVRDSRPIFGGADTSHVPVAPAEIAVPPIPAVPAGMDPAGVPAFSFLSEARPIFTLPPSVPGPAPRFPLGFLEQARPFPPGEPGTERAPAGFESELPPLTLPSSGYDVETIRRDFPILRERVNGRPLVWLDNAATTQKPQSVIDRLSYFYAHENSNVHRAAHELAARATDAYESAREKVRRFLNASSVREIIFVRGTTEGINLIAQSWGRRNIRPDDEIVITWLEHHANIVPWQMLCSERGAKLRVAPVDDRGQVILEEYEKLLGPKTRLVSLAQVSNALGTITPSKAIIDAAHRHGARVLLDGAQAVSHMPEDVQLLDCDFFVLSGHKMFGPTGIGAVYGKSEVLEAMPPWQGGGSMIQDVTFERSVFQPPPARFEAGTGNIADAVGLGAAIDYLDRIGMANVARHEHELLVYATAALQTVPGLHIIGTAPEKAGVLSFILDGHDPEEVGSFLNREGIAVRAGHHCAQPILRRFGLEKTVRASLALYNNCEDIDALVAALFRIQSGQPPQVL